MNALNSIIAKIQQSLSGCTIQIVRNTGSYMKYEKTVRKPGRCYRRIVHYPEKYTVEPLNSTNLGGRDPDTGRLAVKGIGGGIKQKYHWIDWIRAIPPEDPPLIEKVLQIIIDGNRTAHIALVGGGKRLRYVLATENMKLGDIIKTSSHIPRIPVRPNEGDAYPLGALQMGTKVHCVEKYPGTGGFFCRAAGTFATLSRKVGDRVIVQLPNKHEYALKAECMAVVGRVSNAIHNKIPIGSAQRNRELGNRPRSGLWQRKDGRFGRKIWPLPPVKYPSTTKAEKPEMVTLFMDF